MITDNLTISSITLVAGPFFKSIALYMHLRIIFEFPIFLAPTKAQVFLKSRKKNAIKWTLPQKSIFFLNFAVTPLH